MREEGRRKRCDLRGRRRAGLEGRNEKVLKQKGKKNRRKELLNATEQILRLVWTREREREREGEGERI